MMRATDKLITIVAEAVLAEKLGDLVRAARASGYTMSDASGEGSRGRRATAVLDGKKLRLEALVSGEVQGNRVKQITRR